MYICITKVNNMKIEVEIEYYEVSHICIFKNGKLIHDPHPTKEGLKTIEYFQTLEKV